MVFIPAQFPNGIGTPESDTLLMAHYPNVIVAEVNILQDILYAVPFFVPATTVIDGLAFENTSTGDSGDDIRMGLYGSTTGGLPGALLSETGEIALDGTRDVRVGALGAAQTLTPATKYWIAMVANATITLLCAPVRVGSERSMDAYFSRSGVPPWNAGLPIFNGTNYGYMFQRSHTYGALPNPFGTVTAISTISPIMGAQVQ